MSNLKIIRNLRGLSQAKLAELTNISVRNIQYYEQNVMNIDGAKITTLLALSNVLNCRISDIIEDENLSKNLKKLDY